jgi:molecular chaperone GrpE
MSDERAVPADAGTAIDDATAEPDDAVDATDEDAVEAELVDDGDGDAGDLSVEGLLETTLTDLENVTAQRDEYLDMARRVQAEFENFRKRTEAQRVELVARAAENLVRELLPVLDACEAAMTHEAEDVEPIYAALEGTLYKQGLEKVDKVEVPFDPTIHEAVLSEPGDGDEPVVAEVLRAGYLWNGRVVRAAMVKVRG